MNKIKNSSMFLLWAGAAISISEIYTGCLFAPLGIAKGLAAIITGHIIGCTFLALGGYLSFRDSKNAMDKVKDAFGIFGTKIVALFNIMQLMGWSGIMIIQGGRALKGLVLSLSGFSTIIITGILVFLWAFLFSRRIDLINNISVAVLFILILFLVPGIQHITSISSQGNLSFLTAVELSVAMPVSWLPLIGDYTKDAVSKKGSFLFSALGYLSGSVLMYALGMIITLSTGKDVVSYVVSSPYKFIAGTVIVLSTVTTTFLDIYSSVISSKQLMHINSESLCITVYSAISIIAACFFPMESFQNFLLLIGSIFVPIYTVVFLQNMSDINFSVRKINAAGIISAAAGTVLYNILSSRNLGMPTIITFITLIPVYFILQKIIYGGNFNVRTAIKSNN